MFDILVVSLNSMVDVDVDVICVVIDYVYSIESYCLIVFFEEFVDGYFDFIGEFFEKIFEKERKELISEFQLFVIYKVMVVDQFGVMSCNKNFFCYYSDIDGFWVEVQVFDRYMGDDDVC